MRECVVLCVESKRGGKRSGSLICPIRSQTIMVSGSIIIHLDHMNIHCIYVPAYVGDRERDVTCQRAREREE